MINEKEFFDLMFDIGLLKKIQRTGWVLKGVKDVESVAEHSWRVAVMVLLFSKTYRLDENRLIKMALIHDLGEIIIGDIKWESGKRIVGSQLQKHRDEEKAIRKIFEDNPSFKEYVELWQEFNEQKTKASRLVKQLDKLEMIIQAFEYQKEGYPSEWFNEFWENGEKYLNNQELEKYLSYLKAKRK